MEQEEDKEEFKQLKNINEKNEEIIGDLKKKLQDFEDVQIESERNSVKLAKLYELGVVNSTGDYIGGQQLEEEDMS
jgi:uncharacterized protein (DUF342 family)